MAGEECLCGKCRVHNRKPTVFNCANERGKRDTMKKYILMALLQIMMACLLSESGCRCDSRASSSKTEMFILAEMLSSFISDQAVIAEGRAAVREIMESTGASSVSVAYIDGKRLAWVETFGLANKESMTAPVADTMYCIGSTSKVMAAIAVMKLVEMNLVSLDTSLRSYLTSFHMASPPAEYEKITVRMLVNHSSGFPGTDERNASTASPVADFSAQVMETLGTQRLKHDPGYMHVYCNDGYTMVEQLVHAVTGMSYAEFLQDTVFTPLGMDHTKCPLEFFPAGSFAISYSGDTARPQLFLNTFASGGLYSTPTDMAKVAMMLMEGGAFGNVRILTKQSVEEMGTDQTLGSFNPVKALSWSYGLGWDTVTQPGLGAVTVTAWQKGGDVTGYGSVMTVAPAERLAVIVMGASGGFTSSKATIIAERILLRALQAKGRIGAMPEPLSMSPLPEKIPSDGFLDSLTGYYANYNTFVRVEKQSANSLAIKKYDSGTGSWIDLQTGLTLRNDDRFSNNENPSRSFSFMTSDGRQYLVARMPLGFGHYRDDLVYAQRIAAAGDLPGPWPGRVGPKWLMVNEHPESEKWESPLMRFHDVGNLLFSEWEGLQAVDPFTDTVAGMTLLIPQLEGRDLNDAVIESREGDEWIRFGSYLYRPLSKVNALSDGTVTIGAEGFSEWRSVDAGGTTITAHVTPLDAEGRWKVYDSDFRQIQAGEGTQSFILANAKYYLLFHDSAGVAVVP